MKNFFHHKKGAVLVMSLLIGSAITIVGVEIAMFVMSSIRQSRTIDNSTVAYYASESGLENVIYQVRKENLLTFNDLRKKTDIVEGASWSVQEYQEPNAIVGVFRDSIKELQKSSLLINNSIQASLYKKSGGGNNQVFNAIPGLKSMKVEWLSESCGAQRPSIELTAVEFMAGGTINWNSADTELKKDIQAAPSDDPTMKQVFFNFVKDNGSAINKPMVIRVKAFFCDLSGVKISLSDDLDGTGNILDIPNYFYINPKGTYSGATRDELKATFSAGDAASSIFDFVLFSQDQVVK